jgi:hypothetical protein
VNKFITLVIGLFVMFTRPKDFVSRLGGWVLVSMATVYEALQMGNGGIDTSAACCGSDCGDAGVCERGDSQTAVGGILVFVPEKTGSLALRMKKRRGRRARRCFGRSCGKVWGEESSGAEA